MVIGEEGRPQGVGVGGIRARGVKVGEGRDERPVPPMMAMDTASGVFVNGVFRGQDVGACLCMW